MNWTHLLASLHGECGVLAAVALLHPAWAMRRGERLSGGGRASVALSTALAAIAFALGLAIYSAYRLSVKRALFAASIQAGYLFETKEHLAFAALALAAGGGACALLAPAAARDLRRAAAAAFASAALLALTTAALGVYTAAVRSFPQ